MIITKFGGSSLASAKQFMKVKDIVLADDDRRVVVVSACGKRSKEDSKLTDLLYLLHAHLKYSVPYDHVWNMIVERYFEIKKELNLKIDLDLLFNNFKKELHKEISLDYLVSRGEYFTALLMSEYLGFEFLDSKDLISFNYDGSINDEKTGMLIKKAYHGERVVIPGFYGAYPNGAIHLLSRGGSDITGSLVAKALNATMYENWTDVSGILMADPRVVDNPRPIKQITYSELRELSYMGANVLHEETIFPVSELNIPINIKNTNAPLDPGTIITNSCDDHTSIITGISGKKNFTSFTVNKTFLANKSSLINQVTSLFIKYNLNIEHIPTSIDSFSVIVSSEEVERCIYELVSEIKKLDGVLGVKVEDQMALVAVTGRNMLDRPGSASKIFEVVASNCINIRMIAQGSQELTIIVGVDNSDFEKAIRAIYDSFK